MLLKNYMAAIVNDLKANAPFLKDVGTHGKVFGADELKMLTLRAPAVRIAMVGTIGGRKTGGASSLLAPMGRADTGQFRGPLNMIAFLIEKDFGGVEARDRVIDLADKFMTFIEHRQFGLGPSGAGPALVTGFEIIYTAEIDAQGAAIAAVNWEQEVWFGRDLDREDMAIIQPGWPQPPDAGYSEGEWRDKGDLDPAKPPRVSGTATGVYVPDMYPKPDPEDTYAEQPPPDEGTEDYEPV